MSHMKAARIAGPRRVELVRVLLPEPGPGAVRVRLEGCGLCGSNLPLWQGRPWFRYPVDPGQPGHEAWGVVDELGDGVAGFCRGDRVALLSERAFAEFDVAAASEVCRFPSSMEGRPFPGEAIGCAMNIFERTGIGPGETVAIVGVGFLGALLTALARGAGARVAALSRRAAALESARRLGAELALQIGRREELVPELLSWSGGYGVDCAIEAVGLEEPLNLAAEITRECGRLVIAGYHQDGLRRVDLQLWNWRAFQVINAHERRSHVRMQGLREAVQAVSSGRLDPSPLYTHIFPLDDLGDAFRALDERPGGFMKALVQF